MASSYQPISQDSPWAAGQRGPLSLVLSASAQEQTFRYTLWCKEPSEMGIWSGAIAQTGVGGACLAHGQPRIEPLEVQGSQDPLSVARSNPLDCKVWPTNIKEETGCTLPSFGTPHPEIPLHAWKSGSVNPFPGPWPAWLGVVPFPKEIVPAFALHVANPGLTQVWSRASQMVP